MKIRLYLPPLLLLLSLITPLRAAAEGTTTPVYDHIRFSVEVNEEVQSDTIEAVLYVQREGATAAQLANDVNSEIRWALALAKQESAINVETLDYRTTPLYRKQELSGWRVRQSIRINSRDSTKISELIARLQKRLLVQSINYIISDSVRHDAEQRLIGAALKAFQQRAQLITTALGRETYRIVTLNVGAAGERVRPLRARAEMAAFASAPIATPQLEPGTQTMRATVSATIELKVR
ncbi:MAG: SIMPL domain-containing protein [Gammaproteobacteria bacterium]|nr:SIMPL domain-containing protein [Gammaproteobacteria bacterium]